MKHHQSHYSCCLAAAMAIIAFLAAPIHSQNSSCPYDIAAATSMVPSQCYANSSMAGDSAFTTGCCWYVTAGYLFAAIHYSNKTGLAFLPPATASACAEAYSKALLDGGIVSPSLLTSTSCELNGTSLAANGDACEYTTVKAINTAVNLKESSLSCAGPSAGNLSTNSTCTKCQNAVISATFALLDVTKSKEFVPCGTAATMGIWTPYSPSLTQFRSYALCMLKILENLGTLGTDNLIPAPPPPPPPPTNSNPKTLIPSPSSSSKKSTNLKIAISCIAAVLVSAGLIIFLVIKIRRSTLEAHTDNFNISSHSPSATSPLPTEGLYIFTNAELKSATNNYDERLLLGEGGAGKVYLGKLPSGHHVAIKRIYREKKVAEFYSEVAILAKLRHPNLTTLVGYCLENNQHILVYEYMPGGNLANALYHSNNLTWRKRLHVAADVAEGLAYLHTCSGGAVVHRDVKPTNILLSVDGVAKLSDFGVSRIVPTDVTHVSTDVMGTMGYVDPDAFSVGHVSEMTDVYSFGVVLLGLVTGQRAVVPTPTGGAESIVHVARSVGFEGSGGGEGATCAFEGMVDPRLGEGWDRVTVRAVFELACRCVRTNREERPKMTEALTILKGLIADVEARMGSLVDDVASSAPSVEGMTSVSEQSTSTSKSL